MGRAFIRKRKALRLVEAPKQHSIQGRVHVTCSLVVTQTSYSFYLDSQAQALPCVVHMQFSPDPRQSHCTYGVSTRVWRIEGKGYLGRVRGVDALAAVTLSLGAGTSCPRGPAGAEDGQDGAVRWCCTHPQLLWHVQFPIVE